MAPITVERNPFLGTRVFDQERVDEMPLDEALGLYDLVCKAMDNVDREDEGVVEALAKNHTMLGNRINTDIAKMQSQPVVDEEVVKTETVEVNKALYCEVISKNEAKRLVTGILLIPEVVDKQGDIIDEESIEMIAHNFLMDYRSGDNDIVEMHVEKNDDIKLVESYLMPIEMAYPEDPDRIIKKGTWIVTVKVLDDEAWNKVTDGTYQGFSIKGRLPAKKLD